MGMSRGGVMLLLRPVGQVSASSLGLREVTRKKKAEGGPETAVT